MEIIFPEKLKKGDRIAIVSPAGTVTKSQLDDGLQLITERGYEPVLGRHVFTQFMHGYNYAGTEEQRISDLNWALNDPDISAIWASRGGYGCQHLLPHLNLSGYQKSPKWYIGYSDNTVIQSYLLQNGFPSLHAQTVKTASFGVSEQSYNLTFDILKGNKPSYEVHSHFRNRCGTAEGVLIGGNLALIYALLGTSYSFDFEDRILFIEEVGEKYYSLDRMLMSLELAGVFKLIKGLIIGGMTNMGDENENMHYDESYDEFAYQLIAERVAKYDFPTLFSFPNGHTFENKPLIIGASVKMVVQDFGTIHFE